MNAPMIAPLEVDARPPLRLELTVVGRIRQFYAVRRWEPMNSWPPESAMYAVLRNPGRSTTGKSDGGMAVKMDKLGAGLAMRNAAYEIGQALDAMPRDYKRVIEATYDVEQRENPRSVRSAADLCGCSTGDYGKRMAMALAWLQGRLNIAHLTPKDAQHAAGIDFCAHTNDDEREV